MSQIRIVNQKDTEKLLDMQNVIKAVENAYVLKAQKNASLFPMVFHDFAPDAFGDMDIKSGCLTNAGIFGLKLVSWFGNNTQLKLPQLFGTVAIFDCTTGEPLGILNGNSITGMRTGAAGAIGAKYLANPQAENLLLIGAGHQAKYQIAATLMTMEHIKTVRIYDPMSPENAVAFAKDIPAVLENEFLAVYPLQSQTYKQTAAKYSQVTFTAVTDLPAAIGLSNIVITVTPARKPIIYKEWVKKGTHFSCVGSDMSGKQEIDETIFSIARVVVDDIDQAVSVGETEIPIKKGVITKEDILGEIGSVILGEIAARTSPDDITIFDSTGIALQDLICAKLVLDMAKEKNIGTLAEL